MTPTPRTSLRPPRATPRPGALAALAALALLPACNRPAQPKAADAERPAVTVELGKAAPADLEQAVEVVGALSARTAADVKSEYSGTITEILVAQWVEVKRGAVLARLDPREAGAGVQAARAGLLQAEVAGQRAARELDRTRQLLEAGLATRQAADEAQTAEAAAQAQVAAARAQLELAETRMAKAAVRAPIDGVVAERNVAVGDYFEAMGSPAPMFRIVDPRVLELVATVPTSRIAELAVGQPLRFTTDARPGQELEGKLSFINPTADEVSRTVKVKAEIPNADLALKPGLFAKGRIVTGRRDGVLVVPRAALVSWDAAGRSGLVFVVEGGVARQRKVETGAPAGDGVEVRAGLKAGDEVVTRGGFNLRDGDKVRAAQGA